MTADDSLPMQLTQSLLLDLLQDISEDIVGDTGLPEVSWIHHDRFPS